MIFDIEGVPDNFDAKEFVEYQLGEPFFIIYNLAGKSLLISSKLSSLPCNLKAFQKNFDLAGEFKYLVVYTFSDFGGALKQLYNLQRGMLVLAFLPSDIQYVEEIKKKVEHRLSRYGVRITKSIGLHSGSMQMDLYYKYDERKVLESMLETLNKIILSNGRSYKFFVLISEKEFEQIYKVIEPNGFILEQGHVSLSSISDAEAKLGNVDSLPIGIEHASKLIAFPNFVRKLSTVATDIPRGKGEIKLGKFMVDSIAESSEELFISASSLNLGTIITGMPGTGKSFAAMNIAEQLLKLGKSVAIISPTKEWSQFAAKNNLQNIRIYSSNNFKINFFKSDSNTPIERFYENLAMLLANASSAGPYRNSLEKALLAAFHKLYNLKDPDPQEVYKEIEEAVIEQHGKRTNVGVKYTKHGENVMAALENLRLLLSRPEFSYKEGLNFSDLLKTGVVFDLSNVSNNMKAFFYSLILNEIYNIADMFDEAGDNELRLAIVLEEAQLIFGGDELSAPTLDLKQRIQDFRKKGIGLILITHSVTDINQSIRRLCQNKLYFRQSPDLVKFALSDLGLEDNASDRMKHIERGVCAVSYINSIGNERAIEGPIFIKINAYTLPNYEIEDNYSEKFYVNARIKLPDEYEGRKVELYYLGEKVCSSKVANGEVKLQRLIKKKRYKLAILGERKKDTIFIEFKARRRILVEESALV